MIIKGKYNLIKDDCKIGEKTRIWNFVNAYGCEIGDNCNIGSFVEIQSDVKIGDNCKIESHTFICSKVTIEDDVFIGHGVMFLSDIYPPSGDPDKWKPCLIKKGASIGSNATIFPIVIGENSIVGAGAVVTKDVPPYTIVAGNPARVFREIKKQD